MERRRRCAPSRTRTGSQHYGEGATLIRLRPAQPPLTSPLPSSPQGKGFIPNPVAAGRDAIKSRLLDSLHNKISEGLTHTYVDNIKAKSLTADRRQFYFARSVRQHYSFCTRPLGLRHRAVAPRIAGWTRPRVLWSLARRSPWTPLPSQAIHEIADDIWDSVHDELVCVQYSRYATDAHARLCSERGWEVRRCAGGRETRVFRYRRSRSSCAL